MNLFEIIMISISCLIILLQLIIMFKQDRTKKIERALQSLHRDSISEQEDLKDDLMTSFKSAGDANLSAIQSMNSMMQTVLNSQMDQLRSSTQAQLIGIQNNISNLVRTNNEKLDNTKAIISSGMNALMDSNEKKLDEIRLTVDEKLQSTLEKRIAESFNSVSNQLEQVYKGLGEMQSLAVDVGGLKKVLSGVKTRGILGEIQLGAILEEILSPEQYETNIATIPGSSERVEFAVKMPGQNDSPVFLPIDSKFPGDRYAQLLEARENCDKTAEENAKKALCGILISEAKDIKEKYISYPYTTNFAVMFLPFEGLYAEVVNLGLLERLQHDYHVNVAGPSTMAALLNSLQMGFKTLAIQKRSGEVWELLGSVKNEFEKFEDTLKKMQSHLNQTGSDLEQLLGTRTRAITKRLNAVQDLSGEIGDGLPLYNCRDN